VSSLKHYLFYKKIVYSNLISFYWDCCGQIHFVELNCLEIFVTGSYIKIDFFETDDDLKFQDEIHGNLIEQIEKTMDFLFTKYIKASISYEGINRV